MGDNQGEALATIGEIARQHGDIQAMARRGEYGIFDGLFDAVRDDAVRLAEERPYALTFAALVIGFFGGLSIALGRRGRRYSRGW